VTDILVIPDPHATPSHDNNRFTALGRFIIDRRPDIVVCLGDFADLPSISTHNSVEAAEGLRYSNDIDAAYDAMDKLLEPIQVFNEGQRNNKKATYRPELHMLGGNHEQRIDTLCSAYPHLRQVISLDDLPYSGWRYTPFKHSLEIGGIHFSHYFTSGVMGRPISGVNISRSLLTKLHVSSVQGHSHLYSHAEETLPNGKKIFGLSAGCFSHPDYKEWWCRDTEFRWWRGVIMLNDIDGDGYYDHLEAITQRKLMRDYQ